MIRNSNNAIYTGIAKNVNKRFLSHEKGTGAKFLRGTGPLQLIYVSIQLSHSDALKLEIKIKKLSKKRKEEIAGLMYDPLELIQAKPLS